MAKTKTSAEVYMRYREKAYEAINFDVPKGRKAELAAHLKDKGMTVSGFLNQCIREELGIPPEEWRTYKPQKAESAQEKEGRMKSSKPNIKKPRQVKPEEETEEKADKQTLKETWLMRD